MVLPNLSELKMIVSRLSHVAEDVTLAANHVREAHDVSDPGANCAEWRVGIASQVEQRANEHGLE